jgi:phytoene synthase
MTLLLQNWENRLLMWAYEALRSHSPLATVSVSEAVLKNSYAECNTITKYHSKTFFMASGLLPAAKRDAARALYAFCRITDDIIDNADDDFDRALKLAAWQEQVSAHNPADDSPVTIAWADARANFQIPHAYAQQLIDGCARDLRQNRYSSFAELAEYAYGVASTVGLMAMHIIGFASEDALPYAIKLGVALQLTNILRDVAEDWRNGRVYLPQDELAAFGVSEADIDAGQVTDNWRDFMRFQIARNRQLYEEAWPGIAMLNGDGRFAIAAAAELYRAILTDIEQHDYDVFTRRASIGLTGKLSRLPGIWWRSQRTTAPLQTQTV